MTAPETIHYQFTWPTPSESDRADAIRFWHENNAVKPGLDLDKRASELLCLARTQDNTVLCAATALPIFVPQIEHTFYCYRTFAGTRARLQAVAVNMLNKSYDYLSDFSKQENSVMGIYMEVESMQLMRYQNEAIWFESRFAYIGSTPEGWHKRLRYFDHGKISNIQ